MKHPTASADLAGRNRTMSTGGPFDAVSPIFMDGDALAGSNMAREMARAVRLDPATIDRIAIPDSHMPEPGETLAQLRSRVQESEMSNSTIGQRTISSDPRKPWPEPTVTELPKHPISTTMMRATRDPLNPEGVDTSVITPAIEDGLLATLAEMERWLGGDDAWGNTDWHAGPKGLDGKAYAFHIRAAIAEIQRQAAVIDELSKPRVPTQTNNGELYFDQLVSEIPADWSAQGYISRMHEVTDMAAVGRSLIGVIAEITRPGGEGCEGLKGWMPADSPIEIITDLLNMINGRDAEIAELQGMLEEAIGPVRLVSELANMTDVDLKHLGIHNLRTAARFKLDSDFTLPRLYGDEDRMRAVAEYLRRFAGPEDHAAPRVDVIAEALGLRRAS